jgi:hypothetical protein
MLAYEAAAFAKIIEHRATQYRDTEPKEIELIRQKQTMPVTSQQPSAS